MTVGGWFRCRGSFRRPWKFIRTSKNKAPVRTTRWSWAPGSTADGWTQRRRNRLGTSILATKPAIFIATTSSFRSSRFHLKGKVDPHLPEAFVFETGTNVLAQIRRLASEKTCAPASLYLEAGGKTILHRVIRETLSTSTSAIPTARALSFAGPSLRNDARCMITTEDQRLSPPPAPTCWSIKTEPLDHDITVSGPLTPSLFVSTSGTRFRLRREAHRRPTPMIYPDNVSQPRRFVRMAGLQAACPRRAVSRALPNSYSKPEPFTPGKMEKVEYVMPDINTFRQGHRIYGCRCRAAGSRWPDRNPQTFVRHLQREGVGF